MNTELRYVIYIIALMLTVASGILEAANGDLKSLENYRVKGLIGIHPETSIYMPTNLAVDSEGNLYVAQFLAGTISVFDQNGTFLRKFGGLGFQPSKFWVSNPLLMFPGFQMVVDNEHIYVADTSLGRIQKFRRAGQYASCIPAERAEVAPDILDLKSDALRPAGLVVDDDGSLYVEDMEKEQVVKFDSSGKRCWAVGHADIERVNLFRTPHGVSLIPSKGRKTIRTFGRDGHILAEEKSSKKVVPESGGEGFTGVAADSQGHVYLADPANQSVLQIDENYNAAQRLLVPKLSDGRDTPFPMGVAVGPKNEIYVSDPANFVIYKYGSDLKPQVFLGGKCVDGQLRAPLDVAVDRSGNTWVADYSNYRVQKFSADGDYLLQIQTEGQPKSVTIGPGDDLYISTVEPDAILKTDSSGKFDQNFKHNIMAQDVLKNGQIYRAAEIRVHGSMLYVCSTSSVNVFDLSGNHIGQLEAKDGVTPTSVAFDERSIFVTNTATNEILVFSYDRQFVKAFKPGGKPKKLMNPLECIVPEKIAVFDGKLLVLDQQTGSLLLLGPDTKVASSFTAAMVPDGQLSAINVGGFVVTPDNKILLTDTLNHRVIVLAPMSNR